MFQSRSLNGWLRWAVVGATGLLLNLPDLVNADPHLHKLECVNVQVAVLESGESLGITREVLRDALLANLKAKLPRLKVEPSCPNRMVYKVFIQNLSGGLVDAYYGHVAFELRRKATFTDTASAVDARAWDLESYVHGTRAKAKQSVLDQLTSHLTQFSTDYQAANP